ncbi:MAG: gamma carbonic anhydrase family protein [Filifactoraceae bacterium]
MIICYSGISPRINPNVFVAESADIIGKVIIKEDASIWFKAVIRGDMDKIEIGERTNIQDLTIIHSERGVPTIIGADVTIGHSCIIHGSTVGDNTLIGMGSTLMDGSNIGRNTIIGANSLVPQGKVIPEGVLAMGAPVKVIRPLTDEEIKSISKSAKGYVENSKKYIR